MRETLPRWVRIWAAVFLAPILILFLVAVGLLDRDFLSLKGLAQASWLLYPIAELGCIVVRGDTLFFRGPPREPKKKSSPRRSYGAEQPPPR